MKTFLCTSIGFIVGLGVGTKGHLVSPDKFQFFLLGFGLCMVLMLSVLLGKWVETRRTLHYMTYPTYHPRLPTRNAPVYIRGEPAPHPSQFQSWDMPIEQYDRWQGEL